MDSPQTNNRRLVMLENVTNNAKSQSTPEARENYFRACEAHGGELAEVVKQVRELLIPDYDPVDFFQ
jgi:hypothetical protein